MAEVVRHSNYFKLLLAIAAWMALAMGVPAVDIQGFRNRNACAGPGVIFRNIPQRTCAPLNVPSILIRGLSGCQTGQVYRGGRCTTLVNRANGPSLRCFSNEPSYTGANWLNGCTSCGQLPVDETGADDCIKAIPNGVHYTISPSVGSWIFNTPNATVILDLLMNVDDAKKVEWLKALGADFVAGTNDFEIM